MTIRLAPRAARLRAWRPDSARSPRKCGPECRFPTSMPKCCEKPLQQRRGCRAVDIVVAEDRQSSRARVTASARRAAAASISVSVAGSGSRSRMVGSRNFSTVSAGMLRPAEPAPRCRARRALARWQGRSSPAGRSGDAPRPPPVAERRTPRKRFSALAESSARASQPSSPAVEDRRCSRSRWQRFWPGVVEEWHRRSCRSSRELHTQYPTGK